MNARQRRQYQRHWNAREFVLQPTRSLMTDPPTFRPITDVYGVDMSALIRTHIAAELGLPLIMFYDINEVVEAYAAALHKIAEEVRRQDGDTNG